MFGHNEHLERKLKESGGKSAWATVLKSDREWTSTGGSNVSVGQAGSITFHQKLRLRVEPDGEPPFECTVKQAFNDSHGLPIPEAGYSVKVIYDPNNRDKLVIDSDTMPVVPGADRDEVSGRRDRALDRAGQMRAIALDGSLSPEEKRAKMVELAGSLGATVFAGNQAAPPGPADPVDTLAKLADLRDRGALTEDEFEAQKARILGSS